MRLKTAAGTCIRQPLRARLQEVSSIPLSLKQSYTDYICKPSKLHTKRSHDQGILSYFRRFESPIFGEANLDRYPQMPVREHGFSVQMESITRPC